MPTATPMLYTCILQAAQPSSWDVFVKVSPIISMVAAFAAAIAAVFSVIGINIQNKNIIRNRQLDLVFRKVSEFDSAEFRSRRRRASTDWTTNGSAVDFKSGDIDSILDFMESIGHYCKEGSMNSKDIWIEFYEWFSHYYAAWKPIIDSEQEIDKTIWDNINPLLKDLDSIQMGQSGKAVKISEDSLNRFFEKESSLG